MANLPENYQLRLGKPSDRYLLINFLTRTYQEFFPEQKNLSHLADTVRQFFCLDTPLWIVEGQQTAIGLGKKSRTNPHRFTSLHQ